MLLLDEIVRYDRQGLCASLRVHADAPFCDAQGAPGWLGLEWMAQAGGAWVGTQQHDWGERVDIGFLLGTRRYRGPARFAPGRWYVLVDLLLFDPAERIVAMDAVLSASPDGERPCASSRIKLFQPADVDDFIRTQNMVDV